MRALIQRVKQASVEVEKELIASIGQGLLILIGIEEEDGSDDIEWLCNKICGLRIFDDNQGVMNLSVKDINGEIIAVSQFTLHARVKKGFRPSYIDAAPPDIAIPLYEQFVRQIETVLGKKIGTGEFGAEMQVSLINDGPVTIFIDTKDKK
ncbi:MAG: D-tyrosyl-tRNA(Tyr) deacylase [Bacteroidales bacterium]|nr:D-tyrosyl-tRNA(Tyr) deacylase [Bacteroidales bacterium]